MTRLLMIPLTRLIIRLGTLLPILLTALTLPAQTLLVERETPDYDKIFEEITNPSSTYYYPKLMAEFERNDTVMKLDKYRRLYLGAMLQEDYDAYRPTGQRPTPDTAGLNVGTMTSQQADSIISLAEAALADNPFEMSAMLSMIKGLKARGRHALADIWTYKLRMLLTAILSTGTGADEENAWHVIDPGHEYALLNALGLTAKSHIFVEPCYEYIRVTAPDGEDLGGFYFNINICLEEYWRKHPAEP